MLGVEGTGELQLSPLSYRRCALLLHSASADARVEHSKRSRTSFLFRQARTGGYCQAVTAQQICKAAVQFYL
ncbi:hypothetical protein GcM3_162006, partial [Golovinomyces cichoracearum]